MARKKINKKIVLPGLYWDGEAYQPASKYPNAVIFTDKLLAEHLGVSTMRIQTWRTQDIIPYTLHGSYACYNLNAVLSGLLAAGYSQDLNKKSNSL